MALLLIPIGILALMYLTMIGTILLSGTVEGWKKPHQQANPEAQPMRKSGHAPR